MKKILIGLLVTVSSVGAQAFYTNCQDGTFNYNTMTVSEGEESINFELSGSTVFNLTNGETARTRSSFKVDKSQCRFSDDRRLVFCTGNGRGIKETVVTRIEKRISESGSQEDFTYYTTVKNLTLEIKYVETSKSPLSPSFFQLYTRYYVDGPNGSIDLIINDNVVFPGNRETGCKYTRD